MYNRIQSFNPILITDLYVVLWGTRTYQLSLHLTSQTWNLELDSPIKPVCPTCPSNFILPVICPVPRNMLIYIGVNWHFRRVKLFPVDRLSYTLQGMWAFRLIILAEPPGKYDNQKSAPTFPSILWKEGLLALVDNHWHNFGS